MIWAALAVATVASCELLLALPLAASARKIFSESRAAAALIADATIADEIKEKQVPRHAFEIFKTSTLVFVLMLAAAAPFAILILAWASQSETVLAMLSDLTVIAAITGLAIVYLLIRTRFARG